MKNKFSTAIEGSFGFKRKHDIHTGVDLYCDHGTEIFAIEDGKVVSIVEFTGTKAESPWWNNTMAIMIEGASGVILYGEVYPHVCVGEKIKSGDMIGRVVRVLKEDKGKPTAMLHLELYKRGTTEPVWWHLGEEKPSNLLDCTFLAEKFL